MSTVGEPARPAMTVGYDEVWERTIDAEVVYATTGPAAYTRAVAALLTEVADLATTDRRFVVSVTFEVPVPAREGRVRLTARAVARRIPWTGPEAQAIGWGRADRTGPEDGS